VNNLAFYITYTQKSQVIHKEIKLHYTDFSARRRKKQGRRKHFAARATVSREKKNTEPLTRGRPRGQAFTGAVF
jgi:hypothetical protein